VDVKIILDFCFYVFEARGTDYASTLLLTRSPTLIFRTSYNPGKERKRSKARGKLFSRPGRTQIIERPKASKEQNTVVLLVSEIRKIF
jgi:hypothetical protein